MIVDTSALFAWLADEPTADWLALYLQARPAPVLRMSWVNVAELCMICARERLHAGEAVLDWLEEFQIERLAPDRDVVLLAVEARTRFPLNFGGCFAYAHARLLNEPLLTLDADFLQTDLKRVLHPDRPAEGPERR